MRETINERGRSGGLKAFEKSMSLGKKSPGRKEPEGLADGKPFDGAVRLAEFLRKENAELRAELTRTKAKLAKVAR